MLRLMLGLALAGCASGETLSASAAVAPPIAPALPGEVNAFMAERAECDHFRGEEPYDAERAAFLAQRLEQTCRGMDERRRQLRARYGSNKPVIEAFAEYEARIE